MTYKKYGEVFRKIRKSKGLPLSSFENIGISRASLGKFECGKHMMAFDRVMLALETMDTSLSEYENFLNDFIPGNKESLIDEIYIAHISNNKDHLKSLSKLAHEQGYPIVAIISRPFSSSFTLEEITKIKTYLYSAKTWGYIELCIIFHSCFFLEERDIIKICNMLFKQANKITNSIKYRDKFIVCIYSFILRLVYLGAFKQAYFVIKTLNNHSLIHTMVNENLKNFTIGYYHFRSTGSNEGKQEMDKALEIVEKLNSSEIYAYYSGLSNLLVHQNENNV